MPTSINGSIDVYNFLRKYAKTYVDAVLRRMFLCVNAHKLYILEEIFSQVKKTALTHRGLEGGLLSAVQAMSLQRWKALGEHENNSVCRFWWGWDRDDSGSAGHGSKSMTHCHLWCG